MPKIIGDIKLYSIIELSKLLGITDVTLRKYIKEGKIQARKVGGAYHVTEDSLKVFFNGTFEKAKTTAGENKG